MEYKLLSDWLRDSWKAENILTFDKMKSPILKGGLTYQIVAASK